MPFQGTINQNYAPGVPGFYADVNPITSPTIGCRAKVDCYIGRFVWETPNEPGFVQPSGTGAPLGFAVRNISNPLGINEEASLRVPAGWEINVNVLGGFTVTATTVATVGQTVFANLTDGTIATGDAGATVSGHAETPWKVVTPAATIGDQFKISNWKREVIPAAGGGTP